MRVAVVYVIRVAIAVIVLANILYYVPPTRLFVLYAVGRAGPCPLGKAVHAFGTMSKRVAIQNRLDADKKLIEIDPAGYHLLQTGMGRYWVPARNDGVLTDNLAEQATQVYGDAEDGVHRGDVVFDCGANVGVYTRVALAAGAKLVVAVEPAPEDVECLRRNFAAEIGQGRVIVVPKGVWDREDTLVLFEDAGSSARDSFVGSWGPAVRQTRVPLTTIDRLVEELKLDSVDFIKMDIEGAEKRALAGSQNTLRKFHPRMAISTEHLLDDPVAIPRTIHDIAPGYRVLCGDCIDAISRVRPDVLFFR
jgi:FkbM family methyltransferase